MTRLSQHPPDYRLTVYCDPCERSREFTLAELVAICGDLTVPEVRERVRCSECGERTRDVRLTTMAGVGFKHGGSA